MYKERLKKLRENKEITQSQISALLKVHDYVYGQYEREYVIIPIKHLITLANHFNVSIDYLFGFTQNLNYANYNQEIDLKKVGGRLKEFRKEHKLTQVKLASIINIGKGTIAGYEVGNYLIATPFLYTICNKYHISSDYLLGRTDEPKYLNK